MRAQPQHRARGRVCGGMAQYGGQEGHGAWCSLLFPQTYPRDIPKPEAQKCTQNWRLNMRGILSCEDLTCGGNVPNSQVSPALVPQHQALCALCWGEIPPFQRSTDLLSPQNSQLSTSIQQINLLRSPLKAAPMPPLPGSHPRLLQPSESSSSSGSSEQLFLVPHS